MRMSHAMLEPPCSGRDRLGSCCGEPKLEQFFLGAELRHLRDQCTALRPVPSIASVVWFEFTWSRKTPAPCGTAGKTTDWE